MCRKWIIRDGIVTVQGDKENLTCLEKICRLDGKMRKYYEMIYQALDELTEKLIVDDYEKGKTYNEGDYCLYDDTLWLCIEGHTASDFDASKWQKVTITDVLKILNDNLRTTIETVNTTVQSVNITIQTVQGLIGTVTDMQGTMGSYNDRITALENAPSAEGKTVVYSAKLLNVSGQSYKQLRLSNAIWSDIRTAFNTGKHVVINAESEDALFHYEFAVGECGTGTNTRINVSCNAECDGAHMLLYANVSGTVLDTNDAIYVSPHMIVFD